MGDFNINWNKPSTHKTSLEHSLGAFGLSQKVVGLTHVSHLGTESLIDLNFTTESLNVKKCSVLTTDLSDHYCTHLIISTSVPRNQRKIIETRSFKNFSPELFIAQTRHAPFLSLALDTSLSISQRVESINHLIISILDQHAPVKRIRVRGTKCAWMTTELHHLIKTRNKFHRKISANTDSPSDNQIKHYLKFRNYVTNKIRRTKKLYYSQTLSTDRKSFFRCLQTFTGKARTRCQTGIDYLHYSNKTHTDSKQIADSLNHYFTNINSDLPEATLPHHEPSSRGNKPPFQFQHVDHYDVLKILMTLNPNKRGGLTQIPTFVYQTIGPLLAVPLSLLINECLSTGDFPDCLKLALVTPIHKKGDPRNPSNYRPISSLPVLSKVFETVIHQQLSDHLDQRPYISLP